MTTQSAHFADVARERVVVARPCRGKCGRLALLNDRKASSERDDLDHPDRRCAAPRARRERSRRPFPFAPPTIASFFRIPLWAFAGIGGICDATHASSTSSGAPSSSAACAPSPMSSTTIRPHASRFTRCPRLTVAKVRVRSARHDAARRDAGRRIETAGDVERDDRSAALRAACSRDRSPTRSSPRGLPLPPVPRSPSTTTRSPRSKSAGTSPVTTFWPIDASKGRAHCSAIASAVFAATGSMTRTRAPLAASARATTHASPPLFPGPASTRTPRVESLAVAQRDLGGRRGAGALHERSRWHAGGDSRRVARRRLRAGDDADERTHGLPEAVDYFCDVPTVRP